MSELEPIFASTTGQLECGCWFDQPGVIHAGDWRDCPDHGPLIKVLDAQTSAPEVIGATPTVEVRRVRILLNPDPRAPISGYRPGTTIYPVLAYLTDQTDDMWLLDSLLRQTQYLEAAPRAVRCGDVVAIGTSFYTCAGVGWERIAEPFVGHGPFPRIDPADATPPARPDLLDGPI